MSQPTPPEGAPVMGTAEQRTITFAEPGPFGMTIMGGDPRRGLLTIWSDGRWECDDLADVPEAARVFLGECVSVLAERDALKAEVKRLRGTAPEPLGKFVARRMNEGIDNALDRAVKEFDQ